VFGALVRVCALLAVDVELVVVGRDVELVVVGRDVELVVVGRDVELVVVGRDVELVGVSEFVETTNELFITCGVGPDTLEPFGDNGLIDETLIMDEGVSCILDSLLPLPNIFDIKFPGDCFK
jgi:hypothetical protein